jgi:uncharacterized protein YacL (UPF0231 family)
MQNDEISIVKPEDRTGDGNLLPEARERALNSVRSYLKRTGYLNVSDLAAKLHLSRQTTMRMAKEVIEEWREDEVDQTMIQIKWYESVLKKINRDPETFSTKEIEIVRLKSMILGKINELRRMSLKENEPKRDLVNLSLIGINVKRIKAPEVESRSEENKIVKM